MTGVPRSLTRAITAGGRRLPPIGLILLAAIGASLLAVIASTAWPFPNDEQAYWRAATRFAAGGSMYDPAAVPGDGNFGYWYPPPLAQVLAPVTGLVSPELFSAAWTILLLGCLWWLGGRNLLVALALIAFLPVAIELRFRNVHLVLAVLVVLALRRSALFWIPAAAIKVTPVLGVVYLAAARRWRDAALVSVVGAGVLALSVVASPSAWMDFLAALLPFSGTAGASLIPIPFFIRALGGLGLAIGGGVLAGKGRARASEIALISGLVLANPTLWMTAFSLLVAIVPLWRTGGKPAVTVG